MAPASLLSENFLKFVYVCGKNPLNIKLSIVFGLRLKNWMVAMHIHIISSLPWMSQVAIYMYEIYFFMIYIEIHVIWASTMHKSAVRHWSPPIQFSAQWQRHSLNTTFWCCYHPVLPSHFTYISTCNILASTIYVKTSTVFFFFASCTWPFTYLCLLETAESIVRDSQTKIQRCNDLIKNVLTIVEWSLKVRAHNLADSARGMKSIFLDFCLCVLYHQFDVVM